MSEQTSVPLEQLRQALAQPNTAIRKRALALIYNEAKVEAAPLLEEYLGRETDSNLQALTIKVLEKLKSFRECAGQVPTERLVPLLQSPDPQARLLGLRAAASRCDADLANMVIHHCSQDDSQEARELIAQILRTNPQPTAIPLLLNLVRSETEKVRQDAIEAMLHVITRHLYPEVLKTLLDPSPALKMRAYQLISRISRPNLLEALEAMLDASDPETNRFGGKLLPSFLNPDLIPLLSKHITHQDSEAAALCKRALILLAQKGHFEAAQLVEKLSANGKPAADHRTPASSKQESSLRELKNLLTRFPEFVQAPFQNLPPTADMSQTILRIKELFARVRAMIAGPLVTTYFVQGRRTQTFDRIAFRALQQGMARTDLPALIMALAPAFDAVPEEGDLYPITIAFRSKNTSGDPLSERLDFLQNTILALDSRSVDTAGFFASMVQGAEGLLKAFELILTNRLIVKCSDASGIKILDFMKTPVTPADAKLLVNFDLPLNVPTLINGTSSCALSLTPFLKFDAATHRVVLSEPGEHDLWEYLIKLQTLDAYLAFLKEKSN